MSFATCDRKTVTGHRIMGSVTVDLWLLCLCLGKTFYIHLFQLAYLSALLTLFISLMKGVGELSAFHLKCSALAN